MLFDKTKTYYHKHRQKSLALIGAVIILLGLATSLPLAQWLTNKNYVLDAATLKTIGTANPKLANKLVFNPDTKLFEFNADAKQASGDDPAAVAERLKHKVTGDASNTELYALDISPDANQGMTVYDVNSNLSFKIIPQFHHMAGRKVQDRLVYPLKDDAKAIYTVKDNGLKEDIVFTHSPQGGAVSYSYQLDLPDTLEARLNEDGSTGIYSADPNLFGDISYGSDQDQEKVESARKLAPKNHKVFTVPAPVITTANDSAGKTRTWLSLDNNLLTVHAENLNTIHGTFSIDPSVTITSSSDFAKGNDEGGVEYGTDEIKRGGLTGGSVGSWTTETNQLATNRDFTTGIAYNGFLYSIGGYDQELGTQKNDVAYAPINTDGSLGAWTISPNTFTSPRFYQTGTIYNGYMYVTGGRDIAGARFNDVQYAKVNGDGSIGSWNTTTSYTDNRTGANCFARNGYLYVLGGYDGSAYLNTVIYSPIHADGSVGNWTSTSSFAGGRTNAMAATSGDYAYIMGGATTGYLNTVQYAKIHDDGSISAWMSTSTLPSNLGEASAVYHNGYMYISGGTDGGTNYADLLYAPVYANGSLGEWQSIGGWSFGIRHGNAAVAYKSNLYIVSGRSATTYSKEIMRAQFNPPGATTLYQPTTSIPTSRSKGKDYGRQGFSSVAYHGYLYIIGGYDTMSYLNDVQYAPINSDGTIGTWTATTSFTTGRFNHTSVAYNGYLYVIGGYDSSSPYLSDVQYAPIYSDGTLGTWSSTTSFTTARNLHSSVVYNGYLYVLGGYGVPRYLNDVQYAPINSDGTLGSWSSTTSFTTAREALTAVTYAGYLYIVGGKDSSALGDVQYAPLNSDGTVGTWNTTTSYINPRENHASIVYNGYLYIIGGYDSAAPYLNNDVQYAPINSDGTLGSWSMTTSFATARYSHAAVVYGGYLYVMGGSDNSTYLLYDVQYAKINNGGPGTTSSWATTANFSTARDEHTAVAYDGYMYITGGASSGSSYLNDVQYAPINPDGTVGTWTATSSFTTARSSHTAVAYNGYLYVIGGYDGNTFINDVQYAPINPDGSIGTWSTTTSFPNARYGHASVAYNGYLYVIGGLGGSFYQNDVQYAPINPDGTVGTWTATSSFTTGRESLALSIQKDFLYISGGLDSAGSLNDVQYAPINPDGTVGTWTATSSFDGARYAHNSVAYNGYIYIVAGEKDGVIPTYYNDVQYAPINANGSLGKWRTTTSLASTRFYSSSLAYNGNLYVLGGFSTASSSYLNDVQYASLKSISRTAHYSKLIDLGTVTNVSSITYTGSLPNGVADLKFRSAGSNGIFGADTSLSSLGGTCATSVSARYIWLSITMSDSDTAVYRDALSTHSSLQDITLTYGSSGSSSGVSPGERLHGGKFFDNTEVLQPLDTAKNISGGGGGTCS